MKRILITTGIFPPDIGGPATFIPSFAEFLSLNKFKVRVITLSDDSKKEDSQYPFKVLRIKRIEMRWLRTLITTTKIARELRSSDIVFCNGLYLETALSLRLCNFRGRSLVKIVGDPVWERSQNSNFDRSSIPGKIKFNALLYFGKIERRLITWALEQFDQVTTPGETLAKEVESWSKRLVVKVVHNGVLITRENARRTKIYDLIVVSRLVSWKNVDSVIAITKELNCSLAIIGDGPKRHALEMQALGNPRVTFLGTRASEEIIELLQQSKIFCQLSDYEGLSFSLLQAMACSIPCLLSDITANLDVFDSDHEAAIFVKSRDLQGISKAVSNLLGSPEVQKNLGNRSLEIIRKKFDAEKAMKKMMELMLQYD